MKDYPFFQTEEDFQMDLASNLRLLGWDKVVTEYGIPGTQYRLDIIAPGTSMRKGLIVECKKSRPSSLADAIAQVCKYRGVMPNPDRYQWSMSWPGAIPSYSDKERMVSHRVHWLNPAEFKETSQHPERIAEHFLSHLHSTIEIYEKGAREMRKTYEQLARQTETYKASMQIAQALNGAARSMANSQAQPGKPR